MRQRSPWISISDLLSGVVLILLLMFVMAAIVPQYTAEAERQDMMMQIDETMKEYQDKGQIKVHVETGMLEFTSMTFDSGSALLATDTTRAVGELAKKLKSYMDEHERMEVLIEGHTDPAAVSKLMNRGGYFSDNIQLSTLRAANVRSALLSHMGNKYAKRIGVAGYGETRLKNAANPLSSENRRIEVRILWNGNNEQ